MIEFSPKDYLSGVLPTLIDCHAFVNEKLPVVIQFQLLDQDDVSYFLTIGKDGVAVGKGAADQVDLTLGFFTAELLAFSKGELDGETAIREGRLRVYGDEKWLLHLARSVAE